MAEDTVARLGGDEFAILANRITAAGLASLDEVAALLIEGQRDLSQQAVQFDQLVLGQCVQ